ncbi:MAG TPA: enoyl-CoA hydratase/isomerase family protein [Vicinamibacterales bacterium]|nr:enoyl-CoA hydratase/isomerase family protein [Vicinamibacterales bacterium]
MFSIDTENPVAVLRLEHGKVNAMDLALCEALTQQLALLATHPCRAVVLTGTGNSFSAGVDLVQLTQGGVEYVTRFLPAMDAFFYALLTFPKPVVAALNGHALAGGCIIAACCDHVVMAEGTGRVGVTELVVGVPFPMLPLEIVRARLTPRDSRDLIYSARTVLPKEALALGLVDDIAAPADLMPRATEAATRLSAIPSVSFALTKRAFVTPILARVEAAAAIDADVTRAWQGDEVLSHVRAFLDKRAKR